MDPIIFLMCLKRGVSEVLLLIDDATLQPKTVCLGATCRTRHNAYQHMAVSNFCHVIMECTWKATRRAHNSVDERNHRNNFSSAYKPTAMWEKQEPLDYGLRQLGMMHLHYKNKLSWYHRIPYDIKSSKLTSAQVIIGSYLSYAWAVRRSHALTKTYSPPRILDTLFNHNLDAFYIQYSHWKFSIQCLSRI